MPEYVFSEKEKFTQLRSMSNFHERIAKVKGEAFWDYRRKWESAGRFEVETDVPLQVDIELSTYCNFRCPMCPFGLPKGSRPATFDAVQGWFPFDLFKKVIDEGVPLGLASTDLSYFNEPLLRKDLMSFIDYADKAGLQDIMFSTNAQLLTPEWTERILDSGLTRFMVSLDAFSEDAYRQVRIGGDYARVVKNLEHFLRRKEERGQTLPVTRVSFVKTKLNEAELQDFIHHWAPLVDYMSIQELMECDELKVQLTPTDRVHNLDFKCSQPWHRLTLRANGDALPCCVIWGQQLVMGNVTRQHLSEVWKSVGMRHLRKLHQEGRYADNPVCKRCAESSVAR